MQDEVAMLNAALVDVRKAYLLLHAYQRRVLDACRHIADRLSCDFYYTVYHGGRAPAPGNRPFQGYDWAMLPLYNFSLLFLPPGELADPNAMKANDWMLEVRVINDSTYLAMDGKWEKEPSRTKDPKDGGTSVVLYAFLNTADLKRNWLWDVYQKTRWPAPRTLVRDEARSTAVYSVPFELSRLLDRDAIDEAVSEFATAIQTNLGIKVPVATDEERV